MKITMSRVHASHNYSESGKQATCKCGFRIRLFHSKGACLILVWTALISTAASTVICSNVTDIIENYVPEGKLTWVSIIPGAIVLISVPLSGWVADTVLGNYRIFQLGTKLLFTSTVLNCLQSVILAGVSEQSGQLTRLCLRSVVLIIFGVGLSMYISTALQLCLDQIPDASASSLTSLIAWFFFSIISGYWMGSMIYKARFHCISNQQTYNQISDLLMALCVSLIIISDICLAPKWLIIEPKCPQTIKTIYRVLKFAAKHKAPLNRSALTYWEEDIPSRLDLGKSKYGGPFTTEEVEDVKTTFKMLVVSISLLIVTSSMIVRPITSMHFETTFPNATTCTQSLLTLVSYHDTWWCVIGTILYEFAIYPVAYNVIPSTLKRVGIVSLLATIVAFDCLILSIIQHYYQLDYDKLGTVIGIVYLVTNGFLLQVLVTGILEFVCAQSPYKMRGFFAGYVILMIFVGIVIGLIIGHYIRTTSFYLPFLVKTLICFVSFIIHCITTRWYKKRVRDEVYSPHRVIEEVYDRYLSTASQQYRH